MRQNVMLNIETEKPLTEYGNTAYAIMYDATKKSYYVITRERLFKEADDKTKKLEKEFKEFKEEMTAKYNQFLQDQKEFNSKTIEMVKAFTIGGSEE